MGNASQFNFTGGTLHAGVVDFNLVNNGGTLAPGQSPGGTTINGSLQINSGALEIELASLEYFDTVTATGGVMLGGDLSVALLGGFVPDSDDQFTILTGQSIDGPFANLSPSERIAITGASGSFLVTVGANQVTLSDFLIAPPAFAGDYNDDGIVDAADYVVWRKYLGTSTSLPNETESLETVDLADYNEWRAHFGAVEGSESGAASATPEPTTTLLAVVAILGLLCSRLVARQ